MDAFFQKTFKLRKAINKLVKEGVEKKEGEEKKEYELVRKIFEEFRNGTGKGKPLPTEESWGKVINLCKGTSRGMSSFHLLILKLGNVKFQHEQKLLLAFFLAFGGNPEIEIVKGTTKNEKTINQLERYLEKTSFQVCNNEDVKTKLKQWVEAKDGVKETSTVKS